MIFCDKKRIAIVVQRYGTEVNGGAEQHARRIAERLVEKYDVSVLTTTALSETWAPFYEEGVESLNGVRIYRFHSKKRDNKLLRSASFILRNADGQPVDKKVCTQWINSQGPYCPQLIEFIKEQKDNFEAFLFVTYLFYHTIMALPYVKEKAIFLPTAHDEPPIYFCDVYDSVFCGPKDFLFNSIEEQKLVHRLYQNESIRSFVVGEGVDTPSNVAPAAFKAKFKLEEYIIYTGRIGTAKQCDILLKYFEIYQSKHPSNLKLVLVGRSNLPESEHKNVVFTGFISDQEKFDAMAGAKCLVMPSQYESLCMAVLEALSVGTPVLVNGKCAVTRGHCQRGNCGLYYRNYDEFDACLHYILHNDDVCKQMGRNGKKYIQKNYTWDKTLNYIDFIMNDYN